MAASGIINALIRVEFSDLFSTRYGLLIVTKTVLTILLAVFGLAHRQITIPQLERRPELFRRVAFVEVLVMAATVGVAISMGRTPPPPPRDPNLNNMQVLLGYELLDAPTVTNIWTMYRYDLMFGTLGLGLAALYGYA
ncbi:CopD family protein, partial [Acinetobacter baumannii]|nr:CopD family protein [Acinetobacter baumannii]